MQWIDIIEYWQPIEAWLDGLSNGETALYLGLIPSAIIGAITFICKNRSKKRRHKQSLPVPAPPDIQKAELPAPEPPPRQPLPDIKQLPHTSNTTLFGRKKELAKLTRAWNSKKTNIFTLIAMGGTGKTALMKTWLDGFNDTNNQQGADNVYTWSFYTQGSAEDKQADADPFFDAALAWFGYQGDSLPSAHQKGLHLAELINRQRTLLVLDGLEPLQYPMGGSMDGALRDEGLKVLFNQLALQNKGLLLISSRQKVVELEGKPEPLVIQYPLPPLSVNAGISLFKAAGIKGTDQEFASAIKEVDGHAFSLNILAQYLRRYENSDIKQRGNLPGLLDFPEENRDTRHAFTIMAAYERQLQNTRELEILYMIGLFDRPVSAGAIGCLRAAGIAHLPAAGLNEKIFQAAIGRLREQNLLNRAATDQSGETTSSLDAHPLVRQYFGKQLKTSYPDTWQQAHATLYDYFKNVPEKEQPDTLGEMEPLFAAIGHGCAAGLHQQALDEVYWPRIKRKDEHYLTRKLGAFGADLSALAHFFEKRDGHGAPTMGWQTPAAGLSNSWKAEVLNDAAFRLRALGRLEETVNPLHAAIEISIKAKRWKEAAIAAGNLSELQLTRGVLVQGEESALNLARQSVQFADQSEDEFERIGDRTTLADALHQAGEPDQAMSCFIEAEKLQQERQPDSPQLYSLAGFRYCDLLLTAGEWRQVEEQARQTIKIAEKNNWLLDIALDQLSLGRAGLQQAITESTDGASISQSPQAPATIPMSPEAGLSFAPSKQENKANPAADSHLLSVLQSAGDRLNQAVDGLRKAGAEHHLPRGLLARAACYRWCCGVNRRPGKTADHPDAATLPADYRSALQDLQETREITQRGGMRLHLTDYHLETARLILSTHPESQPFGLSAGEHVEAAGKLIEQTGYKRRLPELVYLQALV